MAQSVAIVGAGGMGRLHAVNLSKLGAEIMGVCDTDAQAASALANAHNTRGYARLEDLLREMHPSAVCICLPSFAHNGEVVLAASKGIHIFIEKPIGISTQQAEGVVRAVIATGVKTQVG